MRNIETKEWIKVKRGMVKDPKHRQAIGSAIWVYLELIDIADWETGIVDPYKDDDMAAEMAASVSWIRKMRRLLEEAGYIESEQLGPKGMRITIIKWINPRSYSGEVKNKQKKSGTSVTPLENKGDTESVTESITETDTEGDTVSQPPSIRSGVIDQESGVIEEEKKSVVVDSSSATTTTSELNIFRLWEQETAQTISPLLRDQLIAAELDYGLELFKQAVEEAVSSTSGKGFNLTYVLAILTRWRAEGKGKLSGPKRDPYEADTSYLSAIADGWEIVH